MGEFAGYAVDECLQEEDFRLDYRLGFMTEGQAFDRGVIDSWGGLPNRRNPFGSLAPTTYGCKYCKKRGLKWTKTDSGWRLAEMNGSIHSCMSYSKEQR